MPKLSFKKSLLVLFNLIVLAGYAKAQPANDNPCTATAIPVGTSCTFTQFTTVGATNTPGAGNPGCANYSGGDVWFSAVVPASGSITFDTNTGGMTDGGMAVYTGTCGSLTLLDCNDDGSANGLMPSLTETGLTPGTTIFIRVWEYGNDNPGTFSICAQAGPTCNGTTANAACATAEPFCTGVSYDYCNTTGVPSLGGGGIYGCLLTAPNPAFYFMNIATSGPVNFNISQQTFGGVGIDVDFVLWGPFASQAAMCAGLAAGNIVDCSYSTAATETANIPNALAGQWYMMLITNYSDQAGVINFNQTNSGNPNAGVTNCNIVTATPGVCSGGFFTLTGAVTIPSPPASGTLTITNSCGGSQVINAPFTSPVNYSIPNICGNGNTCSVTAVFSAAGAPVILPTNFTAPSCNTLTATPGGCVAGGYVLSGSLTTGCLPATGTLTISSSCGGTVVFNAPFTSPQAWSLPASNGTGGNCTVTAVYSAAGAPVITPFVFTEPSCCGSDAGTITVTHINGTQTTLANGTTQVVLCPGGAATLISNNNYSLPGAGCAGCVPGLMYGIYTGAGPTVPDPDLDPNWTGYYWTGEDFTTANSGGFNTNTSGACSPLLTLPPIAGFASPSSPTNTLLFVPITADATDLPYHDNNGDGCYDIGTPVSITYLNPISFNPSPACDGSVSVNITGGYPQFFSAFYTLANTGAGTLNSTTVSSGGNAVITGLTPGQTYSFSVNDGNGCTSAYSGTYSGPPTVSITPASATVCTGGCVALSAVVTSGVGPGTQTFTSNQCAAIPDAGIGGASTAGPAGGGNWAHTSINVSGVCAPAWNTGEGLTICLNITHGWDDDLNIYIQAPNGVYYLLSDDNGAGGDNYTGTCFSATGAAVIAGGAGAAPFGAGPYKPEGAGNNFSGLNGTPINGTWSLWVADDAALIAGTLNSWSITFTNENTYTYAWSPAAGLSATNILNPNACPAASTTYTLTVTNSCGCPATATATVNVTSSITPTFDAVPPICSGATAPLLPTTSTNGITGTWAPAVSNTATGTYTFTPAIGQCATTTTLTVTVTPNVTPTFNPVAAICTGTPAPVLPTTSTNGIIGTWAPAISNTATGTYTFTPDAGQCATTTTLTVTVNPLITPTFNAVAAICSGDPAPVLPTTSTNGIIGTWAPAISNTATGTYTFTPDAGQCATTTTLTVTVNPLITPTFNAVAAICSGDPAPVLPTTATNGITGTWAPAVNNTATGTYTFTPDAGQCATTTTLTVTVNPLITPTFNAVAAICSGDPAPVLPTTATNGITGTWAPAVSNTATGTYTFTPDAGQCATTTTLTVTVNPLITPTFNAVTAICSGDPAPVLPTTATNGITGTWAPAVSNTATGTYTFTPAIGQCATTTTLTVTVTPNVTPTFNPVAAICTGTPAPVLPTTSTNGIIGTWAPAISNTATGTYTFTPDAGQCATTTTLTVTVNPLITPTFNAVAAICSGDPAPVLPTTSTNGIIGTWAPAVSNTSTGTYTFTPDAGQCATTTTLTVTVNPLITPTFNAVAAICSGDPTPVLPTTSTNGITGTWAPAVSNTATGTYTFTPDAGQCATTTTLTVTVNLLISPTFNAVAAICSGDPAPVLPTTSTNGIIGTWAPAVSNTATGTYTFTPDAGQCATTTTITVTVNTNTIPIFAVVPPICSGSTAPVLPTTSTNGITGIWSPVSVNNTTSASYTFTPDAGQCAALTSITIIVNSNITPAFDAVPAICSGSSAPVLPTTSDNGITGIWAPAVSNTATGTYTFTPDAGQCALITTLTVIVNPIVTSTTNTTICANLLPYNWNGNNYPAAGTYSVTLVSAAGCDSIASLNLTVSPNVTSTTNTTICTNQLPYNWNGNNYPAAGTYSVTLVSAAGCDSIASLNLTVSPNVTSTTNTTICTNQLPYNWNGNNYPAAGTYSVTLVSAAGCDSIASLNLTVSPNVTSTTNIIICTNQLPYTWNGNNYPAAGTYPVTLISAAGCDSIATLNLTANANVTGTTDITICTNQLPYNWNSNSYPAAGTYSVTLVSAAGCDSIATLNLTANAVVASATNVSICNNQLPYNWNGNNYPGAGSYSVTLVSESGCDSIATLNLTVNPVVTSTTNTTICNNLLPYNWNGNNYPAAGTYSVTLVSAADCDSIASLNLTVNPVVTSTTNTTICNNQLPYNWNANSYPAAGTYSVTLVSSGGCDSIATLNLTANAAVTSTTDITICNNQLPYSWNSNSYAAAGTYSVTLVSAAGCDSIATLNLTANAAVTSTTDITICNNQLPYSWNSNSYAAAGTYSVTLVSAAGCDSIATLNLTANAAVTSTTDITICNNQLPYNWNGNNYPAAGTYSVTLVSAAGCDSITTLNLTANAAVTSTTDITICNNQLPYSWNSNSYAAAGTYSVTLVSSGGCDSIATLNLTANAAVTSTTDISICNNELPYNWNSNSYPAAGTYSVTLISSAGCDSIATLNLTVNPVVTSTTNISVCDNQLPYNWNGNNYPGAGSYPVTLVSSEGCDSIATLNLGINPVVTSATNISICNNQLPYSWNGNSYPAAGTYSVTLISFAGCDSVATLNLTANAGVTSTTDIAICNNQLPYSWNGNSYPAAGTYSVTLVSSGGCDSIATLNLTVNNIVTSTINITICNNQLPYNWNSNSYPAAGTYSVTLVSSGGCDSIATLNLTANAAVTSITDISICNNQLPYNWNGNIYPAAGTYSVTLVSSGGCDSIATLNLTANAVVTSTTDITICVNQLPYNWNGNNYPIAGIYSVTLISSAGCDSIATLNLTVNPNVTSTTNTTICANAFPYSWNGNTYPTAGTYSVTLISSAGCDSIATLNLSISPNVTSNTNITVCNNQLPYSWNGNSYPAAGTYSVTLINSAGCDSITTLNLTANAAVTSITDISICNNQLPYNWNGNIYPAAGTYSVTLVSSGGCDSITTLNLTANAVVTSTTDITICVNQLPYSWNGNSYPAAGTYSVTLINSAGCDSITTLNLTANAVVTSTTDITICINQLPYSWNGNSYPAAGTYSVTLISSGGCDSIATLNLTANAVVTSTTDITICINQLPYDWNGNSYPAAGTYSVTLVSSAGCDSIATLNLTANAVVTSITDIAICNNQLPYSWNGNSYPAAGTYSVTLISSGGCDSIATLNLTVNPNVTSTTNTTICANAFPYNWNSNTYPTAGTYSVTLISSAGCDSIATLNLSISPNVTSNTNITVCNNQLPYSWNGNSYPAAGTYSVTLINSAGCDSITTLNLTTNAVVTSTTDITICINQLPYSWNGNSYPAAGTYSVTLVSSAGCDSIATLNLTANAVVTSTTDITICINQLPYSWNGNSYPAAGTYSVTLVSSAGCDSIATLNLTANAVVTSTTDITICINQLPYSWNGNSYPAAGTYSVTLVSSGSCDSIATLNLTANAAVTSTTDIAICINQLPYNWNGNIYPAAGTYSVTLVSSSGCDSIATLNLTANAVVTSTTDITICVNQLPYSWNGNSYPVTGTYSVTLISSGGCDSIATLNLTANAVVTSTTDITICINQLPYNWNGNSYPAAGTYSVTLVSSAGCDSIATLNLTANAVVTSTTDITICINQLPYSWNGNSYPAAGTYSITLINSAGCDSIATLNLTTNAVVTSTTDITICINQLPYSWNGNSYPVAGTYSVTLISSGGCDSIATLNLTANAVVTSTTDITICINQLPYSWNGNNYPAAGTYSVTLINSAGCDSIATLNLNSNAVITSTTVLTICTEWLPYNWNGNDYPAAGTYSVTLISSSGCDSIATLNLIVKPVPSSTTNITICNNQLPYSWNGNIYPAAGTYSDTLVSNASCDSIVILYLTANAVVTSTTYITICNNQLPYSWNGNSYPATGTYSVTFISSGGCDSIATLNLIANAVVTSNTAVTICNNQLPYTWNSNNYPAAGTYSVTLASSSGCDSIATLNLAVNPVLTSTTATTICNNQLPYSWNGNSYLATGNYSVTLVSSAGCDSIATLNLTINNPTTSSTAVTICINQLPYNWNGNSYPAAGTYSVTLINSNGCDSVATLVLAANNTITSTIPVTICNNQLPYSWNGNSYPAAGTYPVTLVSSGGCDSVATLQLVANPIVTSNTNTAICNTQLPYNWNSNNYPAAGTYSVTLVSAAGCDSIATLQLAVKNATSSITSTAICSTQLPYSWNGQSYATGGPHIVTLVNAAGCDSVATLNLTVNTGTTSSTFATICSTQLPYSWNGQSYATAGSHVVTLVNAAGCDSVATLVLTVNPVATSLTPASTCTTQLPYSWNGQNYSTTGTHTVTLVSVAGCDSIATLNLTINPVATSTTNASTCDNQLPYSWNGQNYPGAGTYSVTLTSTAGCDSIATLHLASSAVATSLTTITVCSGELPYNWNGQTYSSGGLHAVTLTSSANCDSIATLNLNVNTTPSLAAVTSPVVYCQHTGTIQLTAGITTPGSQLVWYDSPAGGTGTATAPTPSSSTAGTISYYVSQVNGTCEGPRALITVTVNAAPDLTDQTIRICSGQTANLASLYNATGFTSNWTFNQQPVIDPVSVNVSGSYQIVAGNASGCQDTAIVTLGINPTVTANAGPDGNAVTNQPYQLTGSGGLHYQWSPSSGLNDPHLSNPTATISHDQSYVLMVIDDIGCFALDTINLRALDGPAIYVPSAFTPNGDNLNEYFKPTYVGIVKLEYFAIFNRYGELMYEIHDLFAKGWDGNYKGKKQPIGNYVWHLKAIDNKGEIRSLKGNVVLIR